MDGVGGSESAPDDAGTGKLNPNPLSGKVAFLGLGLLTKMDGKLGFAPEACPGAFLGSWKPVELDNVAAFCPLL